MGGAGCGAMLGRICHMGCSPDEADFGNVAVEAAPGSSALLASVVRGVRVPGPGGGGQVALRQAVGLPVPPAPKAHGGGSQGRGPRGLDREQAPS